MTPAAARARRYRRRLRDNRAVLAIEVDLFGLVDALLERGLITEENGENRQLIAEAVGRVIDTWAMNSVTRDDRSPPV